MKIPLARIGMKPGTSCVCPRCGTVGRFESTFTTERHTRYGDFVCYKEEIEEFECHECHLR